MHDAMLPGDQQPAAQQLLRLCAFLAPGGISASALKLGRKELPEPLREELESALGWFGGHPPALTTAEQRSVQQALDEETTETTIATGVRLLSSIFPIDQRDLAASKKLAAALFPHAEALTVRDEALLRAPRQTADLWNAMGLYCHAQDRFEDARIHFEKAVRARVSLFGRFSPWVAIALQNLGAALEDLGQLQAAERVLESACRVEQHNYGTEHPALIWSERALASVRHRLGRYAEARTLLQHSLQIAERHLPPDSQHRFAPHRDLVEVLSQLAQEQEAFGLHKEAASLWRERSKLQDRLGDTEGADASFLRALQLEDQSS